MHFVHAHLAHYPDITDLCKRTAALIQAFPLHAWPPTAGTGQWVLCTQPVWGFPSSCLHSITISAVFPLPGLVKMKANSKTYLHSEKSRPTFSGDLAWLQCWCSAFNTWPKPAFWAQVSLLIARSGRESKQKRSHPSLSPLPRIQELTGF